MALRGGEGGGGARIGSIWRVRGGDGLGGGEIGYERMVHG